MKVYCGAAVDTAIGSPKETFERLGTWGQKANELVAANWKANTETTRCPAAIMFNPLGAYMNATAACEVDDYDYIYKCNMFALANADLGLFLIGDSPSIGLPAEIAYCWENDIPMLVVSVASKPPGIYLKHFTSRKNAQLLTSSGGLTKAFEEYVIQYLEYAITKDKVINWEDAPIELEFDYKAL